MTTQPVEANVVLTADNTQYDQAMIQSAGSTDQLGKSVDGLGAKIDRLTKSAGRKLLGITAADVGLITAATTAYGAYEKQINSLNIQASMLTKTTQDQRRVFHEYERDVASLRKEFGTTTAEATQLVQVMTRMSDNTAPVDALTKSFVQLGAATGESSTVLQQSMLQLQRTMGTPQRETEKFNNQLAVLGSTSTASASSILDFANSIAPVARAAGISQTDLMGMSSAFTKAGQDGYQAANVFYRMMSDITYAAKSGSPQLNQYANLVGMTSSQFQSLGGTEQITKVFNAIQQQGPQAIVTLQRLGFDGIRAQRAISTLAAQGGLAEGIAAARGAEPGTMAKGAETAMSTLSHQLTEIRSQLAQTAEAFGERFAGPAKLFLGVIETMTSTLRALTEGPMGTIAAWVMGIAAPFAALAGTIMLASKALLVFSGAMTLLRGSGAMGFRETRGLGAGAISMLGAENIGVGGGRIPAGAAGQRLMAVDPRTGRTGSWLQRGMYNLGVRAALATGAGAEMGEGPGGPSRLSRGVGLGATGAAWLTRNIVTAQFTPGAANFGVEGTGGLNDPTRRFRIFNEPTFRGSMGRFGSWLPGGGGPEAGGMAGGAGSFFGNIRAGWAERGFGIMGKEAPERAGEGAPEFTKRVRGMSEAWEAARKKATDAADGLGKLAAEAPSASKGMANFGREIGRLSMSVAATGVGAVQTGARVGKGVAASAFEGLFASNPWALGLTGAAVGIPLMMNLLNRPGPSTTLTDRSGALGPYQQLAGVTPRTPQSTTAPAPSVTAGEAYTVRQSDITTATGPGYKYNNDEVKDYQDADEAVARLAPQWSTINANPVAMQATKMDLLASLGAQEGTKAWNRLTSGEQPGIGALVTSMINRPGGVSPGKAASAFGGTAADIIAMAAPQNQLMTRGKLVQQALTGAFGSTRYSAAGGTEALSTLNPQATGGEGTVIDPRRATRVAMNKQLASMMGVEISDDQAEKILISGDMGEWVSNLFGQISDEDQAKVLSNAGVEAAGKNAKEQVAALMAAYGKPQTQAEVETTTARAGRATGGVFGGGALEEAYAKPGDTERQYAAARDLINRAQAAGLTPGETRAAMMDVQDIIKDTTDTGYIAAGIAKQMADSNAQFAESMMTRADAWESIQRRSLDTIAAPAGLEPEQIEQARQNLQSTLVDQKQFFSQMLLAQEQYERSRARAEEDYQRQRRYAEYDFNLMRERQEEAYQRNRARAIEEYHISVTRAYQQFDIQRRRSEADYQHNIEVQAKQMATSVYDIYNRVQAQRTSSASYILSNAQDQLKRMQEQEQNLEKLRGMGLSDTVIQQMKLTDPAQAQQLARFVTELTPELIAQFNKTAGSERVKAAKDLVTDQSSFEFQELERGHRISQRRAQADLNRTMDQGEADFLRHLAQQDEDMKIMQSQQLTDFQTGMGRMAETQKIAMDRAADDFKLMAEEIDMSLVEVLNRASTELSGHAGKMARQAKADFHKMRTDTRPEVIAMMEDVSKIIGVEYTPPKFAERGSQGGELTTPGGRSIPLPGAASGAVIPGYTPGRDTRVIMVGGGEAIMRPEWTRAIGEKGVAAMNHAAKYGGFADGGIPAVGTWKQHPSSQYPWARWAGDINVPGSGDYGNPVRSYKAGVVADVVYLGDRSYGRYIKINHPESNEQTLYAHLSKASVVPGQEVSRGQQIGNVGDIGNASGPHLHFEIKGGTGPISMGSQILAAVSGAVGMAAAMQVLREARYPKSERTARMMSGVHPLWAGDITKVINRFARQKIRQARRAGAFDDGFGDSSAGVIDVPETIAGNVSLGKSMARAMGWTGEEWSSLYSLWQRESGWNELAKNPSSGAYGIPQSLPATKMRTAGNDYLTNPATQIKWGLSYIKDRYGDPNAAWAHSNQVGWYRDGSVFTSPNVIGVGENGPEAVIPLNNRGGEFLARSVGMGSVPTGRGGTVYATRIDRSTNFTGPITVQATDPMELMQKLQARQRTMALSRPSLTGSAA